MSIAVVIPLYNHEAFVGEAIRSVLEQSRPVDRVIVVDDGSTDRSVEVVRAIGDGRVHLIRQENAGAHAALNRGIHEAAASSFVGILNSDDRYAPSRVERCVNFLESHEEVDVVSTGLNLIGAGGRNLPAEDPKSRWVKAVWKSGDCDVLEWLGIANFAKTSSNLLGRIGYFQRHPFRDYRFVHDYHFLIVCALEEKLAVIPEVLLGYRTHAGNTIKSSPTEEISRETVKMNLDILREAGPELVASAQMRARYVRYLRALLENQSDFRAEVFVAALAGLAVEAQGTIPLEGFPELREKPRRMLRARLASADMARIEKMLLKSRWYALGRTLGLTRNALVEDERGAEAALALLKRRLADSRWLSVGRRLGFFRDGTE